MKESVRGGGINSIQFMPPLPDWKSAAIQRMGFGNLNKVNIFVFVSFLEIIKEVAHVYVNY